MKNTHMGKHLLVQVYDVPFKKLNDPLKIANIMVAAVKKENIKLLNTFVHQFKPCGVSCVLALAESHASCHTWPEKNSAAIDIFTCGDKNPKKVVQHILDHFDSDNIVMDELSR